MEKLKPLVPLFVLFVFAIVALIYLFPVSHPYGGLYLPLKSSDIVEKSRALFVDMHIDIGDLRPVVELKVDRPLLKQTQQLYDISTANKLIRDSIPVYKWSVRWKKESDINISFSNDNGAAKEQEEKIADYIRGDISSVFDTKGNVLEFNRKFSDSLHLPSLSSTEARLVAIRFLQQQTTEAVILDTTHIVLIKSTQQPHRTDYEFSWLAKTPLLGNPVRIKITVAGNVIAHYERLIEIPDSFQKEKKEGVLGVFYVLFIAVVVIGMIWIAIRRIRSYEIGFRFALIAGIIVALAFDIELLLNVQQEQNGWGLLMILLITPVFLGGALTLMWAVSESIARDVWREKLISIDLISKGRIVHSKISEGIIQGISLGAAVFMLTLLLIRLSELVTHIWVIPTGEQPSRIFDSAFPVINIFAHGIFSVSFLYTFVILFGVSFFRKYIHSNTLLILIGSAVLALFNLDQIHPLVFSFGIQLIISVVIVWTFVRYDVLTSFLVLFSQFVLQGTAGLMVTGNPSYTVSGYISIAIFLALVIGSCIPLFRKNEAEDFETIIPAYAKHITERQRMQQELEIARNVQMSFLPKKNPSLLQFDIASRCAPALEVGGDYYDFIEIGENKLAVAIGDVSGKGTQAAFFMTLTKGFLRALAQVSESPAKVLTQVNHLFYENVERGIFISMIYGVFDTKKKTLSLARAGHNPVIMRKSHIATVQIVNPTGLALGLDAGPRFSESIEEVMIEYQLGDLFIFYTDGFTEAMNIHQEQFGEERLSKVVEQLASGTAKEIMDGIFAAVKSFVGKTKQHDDMTIVVVKVKGVSS